VHIKINNIHLTLIPAPPQLVMQIEHESRK
jgi:hypothetical protein